MRVVQLIQVRTAPEVLRGPSLKVRSEIGDWNRRRAQPRRNGIQEMRPFGINRTGSRDRTVARVFVGHEQYREPEAAGAQCRRVANEVVIPASDNAGSAPNPICVLREKQDLLAVLE